MKQNKYDDPDFFKAYSTMPRSQDGLKAAGEWPVFWQMLPNLKGKDILDLGCGYGWHCNYVAKQGASRVVGVDISKKMIDRAENNKVDNSIKYQQLPIEDINFNNEFNPVISSLAFHYIKDLTKIYNKVNRGTSIFGGSVN